MFYYVWGSDSVPHYTLTDVSLNIRSLLRLPVNPLITLITYQFAKENQLSSKSF